MKIPLSWLRDFIEITETPEELREVFDDLGLVVEGVELTGQNIDAVLVAKVLEIHPIDGADRIRRVIIEAGEGPLEIVCGAMNFVEGNHVPFAPIGAVLPGDFAIAKRVMKGITSNGMLCSARELRINEDHGGLYVLDDLITPVIGQPLVEALGITPDVIFDISVEGNRPDAWSVEGVARDLGARLGRPVKSPSVAIPNGALTNEIAKASIAAPTECGRLTLSIIENITVKPSPTWIQQRLSGAGMRPISNVVDASNYVMLELGQPNHPYDASKVVGKSLGVRHAVAGETIKTLDGVVRELAKPGRGLGDSGVDVVIVDGNDAILGLAGVMGGDASGVSESTTEVLFEAAFFDPMTIARSSKRHGLRSEASARFERGVDPELAIRATARFVEILKQSCPEIIWRSEPLDVRGQLPRVPTISLSASDIERSLGLDIPLDDATRLLEAINFSVESDDDGLKVRPSTARLDVRDGAAGRADVIEEIARLYSYLRLPRRVPNWAEPGGLSKAQRLRRHLRDVVVDFGAAEAWTPTLGSDADFELLDSGERVRVTNPLASEESVLRNTLVTGLVRAWARNVERGTGDLILSELGNVFIHPKAAASPRSTKGGVAGSVTLQLPEERERLGVLLGRPEDDAKTAVAFATGIFNRLGLADVVLRSPEQVPMGFHPTRVAEAVDRQSQSVLGYVGEVSPLLLAALETPEDRRVGLVDLDFEAIADESRAIRLATEAKIPSKFPSAHVDLAFVAPDSLHADDLRCALQRAAQEVEAVALFDVYRGASLGENVRSLAYSVRLTPADSTFTDAQIATIRALLVETARGLGAELRAQ
jgi:phenylalanyl-tRNA synthetase beta chain